MAKIAFEKEDKISVIKTPLILFAICFVAVALLAAVHSLTKNAILQNEENAKIAAMAKVIPNASYTVLENAPAMVEGEAHMNSIASATNDAGELLGYCVSMTEMGYKADITAMIGVSADGSTILGIDIISQSETPGLGAKIAEEKFTAPFQDAAVPVMPVKEGGQIDTISGATISSKHVLSLANAAAQYVADENETLKKEASGQ